MVELRVHRILRTHLVSRRLERGEGGAAFCLRARVFVVFVCVLSCFFSLQKQLGAMGFVRGRRQQLRKFHWCQFRLFLFEGPSSR